MLTFEPKTQLSPLARIPGHLYVGGSPEFTQMVRRIAHERGMTAAAFCRQAIQFAIDNMETKDGRIEPPLKSPKKRPRDRGL